MPWMVIATEYHARRPRRGSTDMAEQELYTKTERTPERGACGHADGRPPPRFAKRTRSRGNETACQPLGAQLSAISDRLSTRETSRPSARTTVWHPHHGPHRLRWLCSGESTGLLSMAPIVQRD